MISVVIIGSGNVATHLAATFLKVDTISMTQINSRNLNSIPPADVTIIAVSDNAISEVSSKITNSFVVHTSGSVTMDALKNTGSKGVFYPLQSFSKDKEVDFTRIPFCLEAENKDDLSKLETLVSVLNGKIYHINSEQRKSIHVAAVFVNNFTNHMYTIADDICKQYDVPFEILAPLIEETSLKIKNLSPKEAQTGPAKRNDTETIQNHLNLLSKAQQDIYLKITQSILDYGKKL
tara:strand:+ start:15352 stop:16056 length:705 start_codon:yes stop_codon:yes gene_type:complete